MARSVGRPSRRKNDPGIFPAAYIRSSTSTVRGKKSAPSRMVRWAVAVASTSVPPTRATTAPSACMASLPVVRMSSTAPTMVRADTSDTLSLFSRGERVANYQWSRLEVRGGN